MYFESLAAALAMDGHGPYVWAAYGLTLTVIAVLVALCSLASWYVSASARVT